MALKLLLVTLLLVSVLLSASHAFKTDENSSLKRETRTIEQEVFSARVIVSFIDGTIGGLLQERKGNYSLLELQLVSNCASGFSASELLLSIDQTMLSFYTIDTNFGLDTVIKGLSTLSELITASFIPILQNCDAPSEITSALISAAPSLTNLQTVNGTLAEIIINKAEVYAEISSALGYWTKANFFDAGVYLGVAIQKTSEMTNTSVQFCKTPPSNAGSAIMWHNYYTAIGEAVGILSDEKVLPPLNFPSTWDWCWVTYPYQHYPGTYVCDPEKSILGQNQFYSLNQVTNFSSAYAPSFPYFDDSYLLFLEQVATYQLNSSELNFYNEAVNAYRNLSFYANYIDSTGQSQMLPLWNTSVGAADYVREFINNTDAAAAPWAYSTSGSNNYNEFCSGNPGDLSLGPLGQYFNQTFIQARRNGTWYDIEVDYFHSNFSLDISGMHLMRVNVTTGGWFTPEAVTAFQHKLRPGQTRESYLDSIITGVIVAAKVSGGWSLYQDDKFAANNFWEPGEVGTIDGMKVGSIFTQGYQAEVGEQSFSAKITINGDWELPYIVGFIIKKFE